MSDPLLSLLVQVRGDAVFLPVTGKCAGLRRGSLHAATAYPRPAADFTRQEVQVALAKVRRRVPSYTE